MEQVLAELIRAFALMDASRLSTFGQVIGSQQAIEHARAFATVMQRVCPQAIRADVIEETALCFADGEFGDGKKFPTAAEFARAAAEVHGRMFELVAVGFDSERRLLTMEVKRSEWRAMTPEQREAMLGARRNALGLTQNLPMLTVVQAEPGPGPFRKALAQVLEESGGAG